MSVSIYISSNSAVARNEHDINSSLVHGRNDLVGAEEECASEQFELRKKRSWSLKNPHSSGRRVGVFFGLLTSCVAFLINCVLFGQAMVRGRGSFDITTILSGTTANTSIVIIAYHILINALATTLLSASNYCMQVLSSPTRRELDRTHLARSSLQVGILSPANLAHIAWR